MIDLLEIYHGRKMRSELLRHLARLRADDTLLPGMDPLRREEVRFFYEAMLVTSCDLLRTLGDDV